VIETRPFRAWNSGQSWVRRSYTIRGFFALCLRKWLILQGEMAERFKAHAWKANPARRVGEHRGRRTDSLGDRPRDPVQPESRWISSNRTALPVTTLASQPADGLASLEERPLPVDYSIQTEVAALRRTLGEMRVEDVDIIGLSHGGVIAIVFALENPRRVRTLTLIEPPAFWLPPNHGHVTEGAREMQALLSSLRGRSIEEEHVERFRCLLGDCAEGRSPREAPQWPQWIKVPLLVARPVYRRRLHRRSRSTPGTHRAGTRRHRRAECGIPPGDE
jgi:pimeloyl-ACP methyl ester carboxylesterase